MKRYIFPSAAAVLLASAAPWALAANQQGANDQSGANSQSGMSQSTSSSHNPRAQIGAPPAQEISKFQNAKLSLTDAINKAQQQQQGKTVAARFEMWNGQPSYFVRTCANNQIWEGRLNANTGELIGQPRTFAVNQAPQKLQQHAKTVRSAQNSLTQAVQNAEQQQGGKAMMAKVREGSNGQASYDVDLLKNGQLRTAMVDTSTGKIR